MNRDLLQAVENNRALNGFYDAFELASMGNEQMIKDRITTFLNSEQYKNMMQGYKYYRLKHKILNRRLMYKRDGKWYESIRTNNKIKNPYHNLLLDQKEGYISGNWNIDSKDDKLNEVLEETLMPKNKLNEIVSNLVVDTGNYGLSWIHLYKDEDGYVRPTVIPAYEIIPIYDTSFQNRLTEIIRFYEITQVDKHGNQKIIYKVELWDEEKVTFYIYDRENKGDVYLDTSEQLNPRPHFITYDNNGVVREDNFGRIPFIEIDNNILKMNDLEKIEDYIDELDLVSSDWSNIFAENIEGFWIVEGGDSKQGIAEIIKMANANGGLRVGDEMKVQRIEMPVAYEARVARIQDLKNNIYQIGQGVDTNDPNLVGNLSGIAIKLRYNALNTKSRFVINQIQMALYEVMYAQITELNKVSSDKFKALDIKLTYKLNLIEDAEEKQKETDTALSLVGVTSKRTVLESLPQVESVEDEIQRIEEEKAENPDDLVI